MTDHLSQPTSAITAGSAFCSRRPSANEVTGVLKALGFRMTFQMGEVVFHPSLYVPSLPAQFHYCDRYIMYNPARFSQEEQRNRARSIHNVCYLVILRIIDNIQYRGDLPRGLRCGPGWGSSTAARIPLLDLLRRESRSVSTRSSSNNDSLVPYLAHGLAFWRCCINTWQYVRLFSSIHHSATALSLHPHSSDY
jgi:hypothetical protein